MPPAKRPPAKPTPLKPQQNLWYAEYVEGRLIWWIGLPLVVGLAALYILGVLDEQIASGLLATLVIAIACLQAMRALLEAARTQLQRGLAVALVVTGFAAAMASAMLALMPGTPAVHGTLQKEGDSLQLPAAAHGPIRLLIHGRVAGREPGSADIALEIGHDQVHGEITRTQSRARLGRRGSATVLHEHNTEFLEANAASDAKSVTLTAIRGTLGGGLDVDVFPDPLPMLAEIVLGAVLLVLTALLTASAGARSAGVTALSCALLFGILVHRMATPDAAVGPEFGALLVSAFAGLVLSTLLVAVAQKLVETRRASNTPRTAS